MAKKNGASASSVTIYNPGSTTVVYTVTGRVIGGDEYRTVDKLDRVGERAVRNGYIVIKSQAAEQGASGESDEESTG